MVMSRCLPKDSTLVLVMHLLSRLHGHVPLPSEGFHLGPGHASAFASPWSCPAAFRRIPPWSWSCICFRVSMVMSRCLPKDSALVLVMHLLSRLHGHVPLPSEGFH